MRGRTQCDKMRCDTNSHLQLSRHRRCNGLRHANLFHWVGCAQDRIARVRWNILDRIFEFRQRKWETRMCQCFDVDEEHNRICCHLSKCVTELENEVFLLRTDEVLDCIRQDRSCDWVKSEIESVNWICRSGDIYCFRLNNCCDAQDRIICKRVCCK